MRTYSANHDLMFGLTQVICNDGTYNFQFYK